MAMRNKRIRNMSFVVCFGALVALPVMSSAEDATALGKSMYLTYCSACHGETGSGDGVVSGFMRPKPTDLTRLAEQAGGRFPFLQTMQVIDGSTTVRAHGDVDMPVWSEVFRDETTATMQRRAEVKGKLLIITEHLASIQK
jgi:mono/diheme cytochrome c family protein